MLWKHQKLLYLAHIFQLQNLGGHDSEQSQRKLVKEAPTKFEETVEKGVHLVRWNDFGKKGEVPVSCEYFNVHTDLFKVLIKSWQVILHELCNQCAMLDVTWQTLHVYVSHLIVFDQGNEKPKGHLLTAVQKKGTDDKIHTLNIANACIVLRESL